MIERAIENWLINTNERNYQSPFCQVLLGKGHRILYVSSHRPMEQGKDIISISPDGEYHAYQLKTGKIDIPVWRAILGEVKELMELPIVHPSVDLNKIHKAYLVTNGEIIDEVRHQIDLINRDNVQKERRYSYLEYIDLHGLTKDFIDAQNEFIPKNLSDFNEFLNLFLSNGKDFLPKEKLGKFFENSLFGEEVKQKSNKIHAIGSSVILNSYLLNPFQVEKNYFAIFEAWIVLAVQIIRFAELSDLKFEDWEGSYKIIIDEMLRNLFLLRDEVLNKKDFIEGNWFGEDKLIYRIRATIVLGTLAALENHIFLTKNRYETKKEVLMLLKENLKMLNIWGESAFPYIFSIIQYLENSKETLEAKGLLVATMDAILKKSANTSDKGLASLYYSPAEALSTIYKQNPEPIDFSEFCGGSYILNALVEMFVRRDFRDLLSDRWKKISYIRYKEFKPDRFEDNFSWHSDVGKNISQFPNSTQSWKELKNESINISDLPLNLKRFNENFRFFILVYPHRCTPFFVRTIDC